MIMACWNLICDYPDLGECLCASVPTCIIGKQNSLQDAVELLASLRKLVTETIKGQQSICNDMAFALTFQRSHEGGYAVHVSSFGRTPSKRNKLVINILQHELCTRRPLATVLAILEENFCLHSEIALKGFDSTQHKDVTVQLHYFDGPTLHGKFTVSFEQLWQHLQWRKCEISDLVTVIEDTVLVPGRRFKPSCKGVKPNRGVSWQTLYLCNEDSRVRHIDQPPAQPGSVSLGEQKAVGVVCEYPQEQSENTPAKGVKETRFRVVSKQSEVNDHPTAAHGLLGSCKVPRPFQPEGCDSPTIDSDIPNACCIETKDVESVPSEKNKDGDVKDFDREEGTMRKPSMPEYAMHAMDLYERVHRMEIFRKDNVISKLKKDNFALRKRLSAAKTAVQHSQYYKLANRSLKEELEEVRGDLEFCLSDRDKYARETHILKLEKSRLAGILGDCEALRNKWEAAQLQMFQARAEKDHYREKSLQLKTKLLQETEARVAAERERQMMLKDYEALQRAYEELKAKESSRLEEQVFKVDDYQARLSMLQSEVVSLKDEHDVVKIHRDKFGSNLRQFASEHESLQEQFMSFSKELFGGVQMKMVQSIKEYERLETAQDTVAEHIKAATVKTKSAENELHKMERETERYRRQLTDFPCSFGGDLLHHVIPTTAARWREFAMYLGIDMCTIRAVEAKDSAAEDCCRDILLHWKEGAGKSPKTWATILEAMRLCGLTKGANEMEKNLCFE